jgi:CDGSH iron-sulfur domain-containing protein 3
MSAEIVCNVNGPLLVRGDFKILDAEGREFILGGKTTVALCRCGQSNNKPFCDGSHKTCSFMSTVSAAG